MKMFTAAGLCGIPGDDEVRDVGVGGLGSFMVQHWRFQFLPKPYPANPKPISGVVLWPYPVIMRAEASQRLQSKTNPDFCSLEPLSPKP